jgi:hypothetical protein
VKTSVRKMHTKYYIQKKHDDEAIGFLKYICCYGHIVDMVEKGQDLISTIYDFENHSHDKRKKQQLECLLQQEDLQKEE